MDKIVPELAKAIRSAMLMVDPPTASQRPSTVGVAPARLDRRHRLVYPQLAKQARIQGVVKLHALISKDGTIEDLKVVSGHPLLTPRRWKR